MIRRGMILGGIVIAGLFVILIFAYDIVKVEWISFMEIQPSYKPMEAPLPPPPYSIPVEGAAYLSGLGPPTNPVPADEVSVARGQEFFALNCVICHGKAGEGDGIVGAALAHKPANLTSERVINRTDGDIFLTISNGIPNRMPALNENLTVRDRWDVVNYIRSVLQQQQP
jgi:mono/diheme cytochrome c family protein